MKRTSDPAEIEHRLLELAYTTDARITPPLLAYFAPSSIEDAERVLDDLAARDRIAMEIDDDGHVYYVVPDRQQLAIRREHAPAQLVRLQHVPLAVRHGRAPSPVVAGALSLLIPGAGQLYTGRVVSALLWFVAVTLGYALVVPGLVLHLFCMASAARSASQLGADLRALQPTSG